MYATARRVSNASGETGINAVLHTHGAAFPWPDEPWLRPEHAPGTLVGKQTSVPPGDNTVHAYLDVIAPDDTVGAEIDVALTGLWMDLAVDESGPTAPADPLPNPVI